MTERDDLWHSLVNIAKLLDNRSYSGAIKGRLTVSNDAVLADLRLCFLTENETNLYIEDHDDTADINVGDRVNVEFLPRIGFGRIVENIDSLLMSKETLIREPRRYELLDDGDAIQINYQSIINFIKIIRSVSIGLDESKGEFLFIDKGKKFSLPVFYTGYDVREINLVEINEFSTILNKEGHEDQAKEILASSIVEMTRQFPENERFSHVLKNLKDLKNKFDNGYRVLLSGFSYEKIKNQVEIVHVEYANKIHKILSDIQNQLIGIPVAIIIGSTQIKNSSDFDLQFWANTGIFVGCLAVFIFLFCLIINQLYTLGIVKKDIEKQSNELTSNFPAVSKEFGNTFSDLKARLRNQKIMLWAVFIVLIVCFAVTSRLYIKAVNFNKHQEVAVESPSQKSMQLPEGKSVPTNNQSLGSDNTNGLPKK